MNSHERSFVSHATVPAPVRKRGRLIAAVIAGVLLVAAISIAALWYLRLCGNCGPIICDDPCSLPTFSRLGEPPRLS
jgi:hypothetical protein